MANSRFTKTGIRQVDFRLDDATINRIKLNWQDYASKIHPYTENRFYGKGIVTSVGGIGYFTCAWILIQQLRKVGCFLPIEVWYKGIEELPSEIVAILDSHEDVVCRNYLDIGYTDLHGVMLKPLAILASTFEEVLYLDADNNCIKNPEYLFHSEGYLKTGTIFWPDYWVTDKSNPIWKIVGSEHFSMPEQESGQILIDKKKCWQQLNLCLYFNINNELYYKMLFGDKDTFKFAWIALNTPLNMIGKSPGSCGYLKANGVFAGNTIVQYGPDDEILFLHRNLLKWNNSQSSENAWRYVREFAPASTEKNYELRADENLQPYLSLTGDTTQYINLEVIEVENYCLRILEELREQHCYKYFFHRTLMNG